MTCSWLRYLLEHEDLGPRMYDHVIGQRWTRADRHLFKMCASLLCTSRGVCRATQPRVPSLIHWFGPTEKVVSSQRDRSGGPSRLELMFDEQRGVPEYACSCVVSVDETRSLLFEEIRWTGADAHFGSSYVLEQPSVGLAKDRLTKDGSVVHSDEMMGPCDLVLCTGRMGATEATVAKAIATFTENEFTCWLLAHECRCDTTRVSGMKRSKELARFFQQKRKRES